jgi:hypothetical protein
VAIVAVAAAIAIAAAAAVAVAVDAHKKNVISTEAAHSLIVSSAVERSPHFVFAFACLQIHRHHAGRPTSGANPQNWVPHPLRFCKGWVIEPERSRTVRPPSSPGQAIHERIVTQKTPPTKPSVDP